MCAHIYSVPSSQTVVKMDIYEDCEASPQRKFVWQNCYVHSLIFKIRDHPLLWDHTHKHFKKKTMKRSALSVVAAALRQEYPALENAGLTAEEVQQKFSKLKTSFQREAKKIRSASSGDVKPNGSGGNFKSKWEFFNSLSFMLPVDFNHPITSSCTLSPSHQNLTSSANIVNEDSTQPSEHCQDVITPSTSGTEHDKNECSSKKKKAEEMEEEVVLKKTIDVLNQPEDDYSVFGDYVASELRQLRSDKNRKKLKRTIMKAIIHMGEMEDLQYS